MSATEPPDPGHHGEPSVRVGVRDLDALRRLILGAVLGGAVVALGGVWFMARQDATNDHLAGTDTTMAEFILAETAEEEREQAAACVDAHERYADFQDLAYGLTEAGATVGTEAHLHLADDPRADDRAAVERQIAELLPAEVQPLLDRYPPPSCDLEAASAVLAGPVPELPSVDDLLDQ